MPTLRTLSDFLGGDVPKPSPKRSTVSGRSIRHIGVVDQVSGTTGIVNLDLIKPPSFEAFLALVAIATKAPTRRLFCKDGGHEIFSTQELVVLMEKLIVRLEKHGIRTENGLEIHYECIASDGTPFQFKYDFTDYKFGDTWLKPMARKLHLLPKVDTNKPILEPPGPVGLPLSGNLKDVAPDIFLVMHSLSERFGKYVKLRVFNDVIYIVSDPDTCDLIMQVPDKRTPRHVFGMKTLANQGVFVADGQQWQLARTCFQKALTPETIGALVPLFVQKGNRMMDVWKEQGLLDTPIDSHHWVENLTYDVICTTGFDYDPRMLEGQKKEPFIEVFDELLDISLKAAVYGAFDVLGTQKRAYKEKNDILDAYLDGIIDKARASKGDSILHKLIEVRCPLTGRAFEQVELRDQLITLLVAGHKTTTLLMTWSLWHIATHADVEEELLKEIREVFGDDFTREPTNEDIFKMKYLEKVLFETLRMTHPVQSVQRGLTEEVKLGEYTLRPGGHKGNGNSYVLVHLAGISHNEELWGEKTYEFQPNRFDRERRMKFHQFQFIPFGGGRRLCLGNLFAITQVKVVLVGLLRRFQIRVVPGKDTQVDPLDFASPLPASRGGGVWLRFFERKGWDDARKATVPREKAASFLLPALRKRRTETSFSHVSSYIGSARSEPAGGLQLDAEGRELLVLWGGEFGTTQKAAENFRNEAEAINFSVTLRGCDEVEAAAAFETLASDAVVVVLMATYNGYPPKNADKFHKDLTVAAEKSTNLLQGRSFSVLAAGNSNWLSTFMKVGRALDEMFALCGGTRLMPLECADKNGNFQGDLAAWRKALFGTLGVKAKAETQNTYYTAPLPYLSYEGDTSVAAPEEDQKAALESRQFFFAQHKYEACDMLVNKEICHDVPEFDQGRSVRQVEIAQPDSATYACGDHLEVIPFNPPSSIARLCKRLGLHLDACVAAGSLRAADKQSARHKIMIGKKVALKDILGASADFLSIPSQEALAAFAELAEDKEEKAAITALTRIEDTIAYDEWVFRRRTFLHALEDWPSVKMTLSRLCELCGHIQPRLYSIASSPEVKPSSVELCCGVVNYTTPDGEPRHGICSSMLAGIDVGGKVLCKVVQAPHMRLPADISMPIICVCGGTGLAPFLGFLQERASQKAAGKETGLVYVYFGCRGDHDLLHEDWLREWENQGVCKLSVSFSRKQGVPKEYVHHALKRDEEFVRSVLASDARGEIGKCSEPPQGKEAGGYNAASAPVAQQKRGCFYLCGSASTLAKDSTTTMIDILGRGDNAEGQRVLTALQEAKRVVFDVWG
eukprot:TRINITY_DN19810_c0_g1_i1.p1 TRINITY_DN19810_c0_g1~~TRINITY_DN19810_c0_g1_i1.p1  ORF type:complete len:1329 (-),score=236.69 TRINITY_DN19810_c0_g1_i1:263-4174(-)